MRMVTTDLEKVAAFQAAEAEAARLRAMPEGERDQAAIDVADDAELWAYHEVYKSAKPMREKGAE